MKEPSQTKLPLITIDGPAGVGKSTIAKLLATKLNLPYLDTGAMFRVLALKLSLGGEDSTLPTLDFTLTGIGDKTKLFCNREPIGDEIRSEKIGMLASRIAKRPEIRSILAKIQRKMGN